MLKVGVLDGNKFISDMNINRALTTFVDQCVLSGLVVSAGSVSAGKCLVLASRTGSENFIVEVTLDADQAVTLGNNKFIYISLDQTKIDDGLLVNNDGSNVASIVVGTSRPASNFIKLATTNGSGVIQDTRTVLNGKLNNKLNITDYQKETPIYIASTGSANAYVLSLNNPITSYVEGQRFSFKANFTNTGSSTVNIYGEDGQLLGAKTIKTLGGTSNLSSGDIQNGQVVEIKYDGTNFQMISPIGQVPVIDISQTISTFVAGESITMYDSLYLHTDGKVYKTDSTDINKMNYIGLATETVSIGNTIKVTNLGVSNFNSGLTIGATYYPNNVVINPNLTQLVTDNESEGVGTTGATGGSGYRTAHYMKFTTGNKPLTLTSAKIGYHIVSSQNQGGRYYYVSARILADNSGVPNKSSVIGQLSTFSAYADTQNTTSSYVATGSISLSANTTYWLDAMVYFDAYIAGTTYIKVLYKNVNVSGNIHGTENLRTAGPYIADTNDLYYDITFADSNILGNISYDPPLLNILPIGKAIATNKILLLDSGLKSQALITPTVGASPYTYKNITRKQIIVSISGGTTSLIQISRDNSTFYQVGTTSNIEVVLGINDYLKITYTVAPVLKILTF